MPTRKHFDQGGFTLIEAVMAGAIAALALGSIFLLNTQCLRILKSAKEFSAASQGLQERVEQLRIANWRQSTDPNWLVSTNFLGVPTASSVSLPPIEERCSITVYPAGTNTNTFMQISRRGGAVTVTPSTPNTNAIFGSPMIRVDMRVTWPGTGRAGGADRVYETSAILSNGGVSR